MVVKGIKERKLKLGYIPEILSKGDFQKHRPVLTGSYL